MKRYMLIVSLALIVVAGAAVFIAYRIPSRSVPAAGTPYIEQQYLSSSSFQGITVITNPKTLAELVRLADYIVEGEIIHADYVEEDFRMKEGTPERTVTELQGQSPEFTRRGTNYLIRVKDSIQGEPSGQNITLYITDAFKEASPALNVGDRYILMLIWKEAIGRYVAMHPAASYFRIDENDKVRPAYSMAAEFAALDNQSVKKVKKKLRKISSVSGE